MMYEKLLRLRDSSRLSQEEVAKKLNVSRQAVQKWESGASVPTLGKLVELAELYHVSVDYLCRDTWHEADCSGRIAEEMTPVYGKIHEYELWSGNLYEEYRQCVDEGKDIGRYEGLFREIAQMPVTEERERMCDVLFALISKTPMRENYPYYEPNELELILPERKAYALSMTVRDLEDQMTGGWYGRICGCLLGKPVEGISAGELEKLCKATGNDPLRFYFDQESVTPEIAAGISYPILERVYPADLGYMPSDDDTNYMVLALEILKRYGRDFTSENIGQAWMYFQPKTAYCTAERVAFVNLVNGYQPPDTARYKNAFREWIGAQIRGDVFGYINPCNPEAAAEMAWRDARISHIKNGIYGEMWVSAMLAAAYGSKDIPGIIRTGLAQIPAKSRLYEAITKILDGYENGVTEQKCFADIASRWDGSKICNWCHTISNAEIVAASLLYGGGDYGRSVCMAVRQGFDTDCNGATVGSILGVMVGYRDLPKKWTDRICDTLQSNVVGYSRCSVREAAKETLAFVRLSES